MAFQSFSNFGNGLAGVASVAGLFGGIATNGYAGHKAHDLAILQHNLQMKAAEYTGTHAHQWETEDLRNAGLNPVLSANSGQTYTAASPGSSMPNIQNPVDSSISGLNAYLGFRSTMSNLENMSANTQKVRKETDFIDEQTRTQSALTKLTNAQTEIARIDRQLKQTDLKYAEREKLLNLRKDATFIAQINQEILKLDAERDLIKTQMSLNNAEGVAARENAISNRINANANKQNAKTNATWTPAKIVGSIGAGVGATVAGYYLKNPVGKVVKNVVPKFKNSRTILKRGIR